VDELNLFEWLRNTIFRLHCQAIFVFISLFRSFTHSHWFRLCRIKAVILVPWGDVQVIMPYILIAGWLIVLPGGDTVARISRLHGEREGLVACNRGWAELFNRWISSFV
jgi:hypothetical protein